ncbi:uncharacterized protein LOC108845092 [Raphanus sativus]|uniref:Uncharacterized protein LOC108845092 n=1 Tax=Raphanus sativus TaxID=3726 RepID=A0A6J0MQP3_RAPSA|nr:uncharacterized protein LOC108845092 [Raphanus sativus]
MSFPIPSFLLEILAELGLAFTQITPTFWRYVLTMFVRTREEWLEFGLAELKQPYTLKRSSGVTGAILLSPRACRSIIRDIPSKDVNWTDKFFVFKVDPVTVGDFDFSRIPMKWNENVELFGTSKMTPELRGLIAALRRGECNWDSFTPERIRAAYASSPGVHRVVPVPLAEPIRPRRDQKDKVVKNKEPHEEPSDANSDSVQSPVVVATPLSVVHPARGDQLESRVPGEVDVEEIAPKQDPGEGASKPINFPTNCRSGSPPTFSYEIDAPILENPEQLAAIWQKLRSPSCELPSLEQMRGRDAYVRMAVANAKAMEACNEYAALMVERLANFPTQEELDGQHTLIQQLRSKLSASQASEQQRAKQVVDLKALLTAKEAEKVALEGEKVAIVGDLESLKAKFKREADLQEKAARRERRAACRLVAKGYDAALDTARGTIRRRKAESAAEIRLQEIRAKI